MKKKIAVCFALICTLLLCELSVSAKASSNVPYRGYEYNDFNESTAAPIGYAIDALYDWTYMGLDKPLSGPQDILVWNEDIYILDSGNSRIVQLNKLFKVLKVYDSFFTANGEAISFENAQGFAIDAQGKFYIADTENYRVLITNRDGLIEREILRPDEALEGYELPFRVTKVDVNDVGDIYVVADSINLGIFVFNNEGEFQKFFASNPIYKTADVIAAYILKPFLSPQQLATRMKTTPLRVVNFCIDEMGYVYTVSQNNNEISQSGMVRCLNYKGTDIMDSTAVFGDLEMRSDQWLVTNFIAIDVDKDGFIYLLDASRSRVFQYSKEGYLISVFGSYGDLAGTFSKAVDLLSFENNVIVLDSEKNGLHVFKPTEYVNTYRNALIALENRELETSMSLWNEVISYNTNSIYPYFGLGMVYDTMGEYKLAMHNFKLAGAQESYSQSFREYRTIWIEQNYGLIALVIIALIAFCYVVMRIIKKRMLAVNGAFSAIESKWSFPIYTLFHPVDGFEQFKFRKNLPSFVLSFVISVLWFVIDSLKYFITGFAFSNVRAQDFNPATVFVSTIGIYLIFVISNWALCSIMSGRGSFKEICSVTSYSLIPLLLSRLLNILLSNILISQEAAFMSLITILGVLWTAVMLIGGLYSIHQYSFTKTLLSIFVTIIGMAVIVLLCILFYTLLNQAFSFLNSIYQELLLRR